MAAGKKSGRTRKDVAGMRRRYAAVRKAAFTAMFFLCAGTALLCVWLSAGDAAPPPGTHVFVDPEIPGEGEDEAGTETPAEETPDFTSRPIYIDASSLWHGTLTGAVSRVETLPPGDPPGPGEAAATLDGTWFLAITPDEAAAEADPDGRLTGGELSAELLLVTPVSGTVLKRASDGALFAIGAEGAEGYPVISLRTGLPLKKPLPGGEYSFRADAGANIVLLQFAETGYEEVPMDGARFSKIVLPARTTGAPGTFFRPADLHGEAGIGQGNELLWFRQRPEL